MKITTSKPLIMYWAEWMKNFLPLLLLNQALKLRCLKNVASSTSSFHLILSWKRFYPIIYFHNFLNFFISFTHLIFGFPATCRYHITRLNAHVTLILHTFCCQPPTFLYSRDLSLERLIISTKGNSGELSTSIRPPRIETSQRRSNMTHANFEIKCNVKFTSLLFNPFLVLYCIYLYVLRYWQRMSAEYMKYLK